MFIKDILNSDMSLQGVLLALLLVFFVNQMLKKWRDVDSVKNQYIAINDKIDALTGLVAAEQISNKDMKEQFKSLKDEFKVNFMELKTDFKVAFEDLHKLKNSVQETVFSNRSNEKALKELQDNYKEINRSIIEMQIVHKIKSSEMGQ